MAYGNEVAPVILKLDTAGNILDQKEYGVPGLLTIAKSRPTAGGGMVLLGGYYNSINTICILLITGSGAVAWCKSFFLDSLPLGGFDIIEDSHGGFVISGSIPRPDFRYDPFLLKLDAGGNLVWTKRFKAETEGDAAAGGIIQKDDTLIFCTSFSGDWFQYNIRLSRVSLSDGSLLSVKDFPGEGSAVGESIYGDLHGGYYIKGTTRSYRAPSQHDFFLRVDSNLQLTGNFSIWGASNADGFSILNDGILYAGHQSTPYSHPGVSSTLTKISNAGDLLFYARYPGSLNRYPFQPDTLVTISSAVNIGNQVFAGGRKKEEGLITALNNFKLSRNNCGLVPTDVQLSSGQFNSMEGAWPGITADSVFSFDIPVNVSNPGLTSEMSSCHISPVLYVDQSATGLNDGSSWQNAFTTLSAAINTLNSNMAIDSILVATGTYTPGPDTAFILRHVHAVILGGYPSGGGSRDAAANPVFLNGEVYVEKSVEFDGFRVQ
jgi:hypothetical protein